MSRFLCGLVAITAIAGCSGEQSATTEDPAAAEGGVEQISGPFPKTIRGTIGYSYPVEEGGPIKFDLIEYPGATFVIGGTDYDAKSGIDEDDAEISVTIEPISSEECGGEGQCFRAY
jgi:hypothetical protein